MSALNKPVFSLGAQRSHIQEYGLAEAWLFNEGPGDSNVFSKGMSPDLSRFPFQAAVASEGGPFGTSKKIDSTPHYAHMIYLSKEASSFAPALTSPFTLMGFIRATAIPASGGYGTIFTKGNDNGIWWVDNSGSPHLSLYTTADHFNTTVLSYNKTYHMALVYSGTTYQWYINAAPDGSGTASISFAVQDPYVGAHPTEQFEGNFDGDLRLYRVALDQPAIARAYADPFSMYRKRKNHLI